MQRPACSAIFLAAAVWSVSYVISSLRGLVMLSLMLAGNESQSLGRAIVKEDEYEEVRWDGIVSIVSWRERVFRLWWKESSALNELHAITNDILSQMALSWLFKNAVSTDMLFSVHGISDSETRPRLRRRLRDIRLTIGEDLGKTKPVNQLKLESKPQYAIRKFQENRQFGIERLYADDVNMLGENPQTIRENTRILLEASKAIGLGVNSEKKKQSTCMIMCRDRNIVRNGNLSFGKVDKFKHLGETVTNINDTREEIKMQNKYGKCVLLFG
ncbi:hypothetical protein ANN_12562 [Periplaneta americana]|uniref:Reverse transcriptase domain-containing protein n=1 Tax=Periplaneta americana TaxID=6978 RepID=A0ABQ8TJF1_PERAM|nr:hypothetical protein ANN_12562 [Periplaneta americana]